MVSLVAAVFAPFDSCKPQRKQPLMDCSADPPSYQDLTAAEDAWVQVLTAGSLYRMAVGLDWVRVFDPILPPDTLLRVVAYCDALDAARCALVSSQWRAALEPVLTATGLYTWEAVWASHKVSSRPPPTLAHTGCCLTSSSAQRLLQAHPKLREMKTLYKIFNSEDDGWSLLEILRLCDRQGSCFLLIKEKQGAIFGAYIDGGMLSTKPDTFGPSQSAVFRLEPEFRWWRARRPLWTVCRGDCLMVGGDIAPGQPRWAQTPELPALGFNKTLQYGESYSSHGFGSPVLSPEVEFDAVIVEVWSFTPPRERWGNESQREANMGLLAAFGLGASAQGYHG